MNQRALLRSLLIAVGLVTAALGQLPEFGEAEDSPSKPDEIYLALVLIGLLNEPPARNASEVDDGQFAHFYEAQETQFQVALKLLRPILEDKGFKSELRWELESNKGKSIYSPEGVQILNQYFKPFSTGQGVLKSEIFVERVGNYFDFTPGESLITGEETPTRSTMLSLLAGFLLRAEDGGEVHAKDTPFTRKMLEFMLLEGSIFDAFRVHVATPQTIHLKLRPAESLSLATGYVRDLREAVAKEQEVEQGVAPQSATRSESDSVGDHNPQPDSEARSW
ncbi:hypothetical protein HNR46_004257 [Haloferula luteola]|uniref:Uncharacterized protein n=1 Tax=Haloferula luteola TaxID=595692 RepID=A0A840V7I8_9BACT|nr:hypothetical protein [Haloferula luteola]MBB5353985.1 hypothetical protein [Haloferula luteola]